jgi:protein O-GlcNAc transferase
VTIDLVVHQLKSRASDLAARGRIVEAVAALRQWLAIAPDDSDVHFEIGRILFDGPAYAMAGAFFRRALAIKASAAEAANGLAFWHFRHRRYPEAIATLRSALAIRPGEASFHSNISAAMKVANELDAAVPHARAAIVLQPSMADALNNLAEISSSLADIASALALYRRTLAIDRNRMGTYRNLLLAMTYSADVSPTGLFQENRRFVETFGPAPSAAADFPNAPDPERRLTVGYVSSDFRYHSVMRVILPWFSERDRSRFRVVAFSDHAEPDAMTEQVRALCDAWHVVAGMPDAQLADLIRLTGVDILVVLAGHFDSNRGLLAVHRPAPVVVSALDSTSSAAPGMHYLLADSTVVPRHSEELFSERVVRLPVLWIQWPVDRSPEIGPLPMLRNRHVTFGSFNNISKITPAVVRLWARVLSAVPDSRLMIRYWNSLSSQRLRARLEAMFLAEGVSHDRLLLVTSKSGDQPVETHLALYNDVDIALDPTPFNGTTTTFEALWMGVPVVTLLGRTMMGRCAASMLVRVGRADWVALDETAYVSRAAEWAADPDRLAQLRRTLRAEVGISRLCNGKTAVRHLERAYRAIWRRWCREQRAGPSPGSRRSSASP